MRTYSAKTPEERILLTMDFSERIPVGETISAPAVTAATYYGVDADPAVVLDGSPILSSKLVGQYVVGGLDGRQYAIAFEVTCSNGEIFVEQGLLPIKRFI